MKLLLAPVFVIFFVKCSFSQTNADTLGLISHKWKLVEASSSSFSTDKDDQEELKDFIKSYKIQFKADLSFVESLDDGVLKGKWNYNSSTKEITRKYDDNGETITIKIVQLSLSSFQFKGDNYSVISSGKLIRQ